MRRLSALASPARPARGRLRFGAASSLQGSGDALKDASTSRIEWKLEGKGMPDWAFDDGPRDRSTTRTAGEDGHQGRRAIRLRSGRVLHSIGSRLVSRRRGRRQDVLDEGVIDDATGASLRAGPGGRARRLLKPGQAQHEGDEARERRDPRSHHDALPSAPRQRRTRQGQRRGPSRRWTTKRLPRRVRVRSAAGTTCRGRVRPIRLRRPGRRRGAACGRDPLRGKFASSWTRNARPASPDPNPLCGCSRTLMSARPPPAAPDLARATVPTTRE